MRKPPNATVPGSGIPSSLIPVLNFNVVSSASILSPAARLPKSTNYEFVILLIFNLISQAHFLFATTRVQDSYNWQHPKVVRVKTFMRIVRVLTILYYYKFVIIGTHVNAGADIQ